MVVTSVLMGVAIGGLALAAGGAAATPGDGDDDDSAAGLALLAGGITLDAIAGLGWGIALLLRLGVSRRRELMADARAVELLGNGSGLRQALERMATRTPAQSPVTSATAHMWIHAPARESRSGWLRTLWDTHPPLDARIAVLRRLDPDAGRLSRDVVRSPAAAHDRPAGARPDRARGGRTNSRGHGVSTIPSRVRPIGHATRLGEYRNLVRVCNRCPHDGGYF